MRNTGSFHSSCSVAAYFILPFFFLFNFSPFSPSRLRLVPAFTGVMREVTQFATRNLPVCPRQKRRMKKAFWVEFRFDFSSSFFSVQLRVHPHTDSSWWPYASIPERCSSGMFWLIKIFINSYRRNSNVIHMVKPSATEKSVRFKECHCRTIVVTDIVALQHSQNALRTHGRRMHPFPASMTETTKKNGDKTLARWRCLARVENLSQCCCFDGRSAIVYRTVTGKMCDNVKVKPMNDFNYKWPTDRQTGNGHDE